MNKLLTERLFFPLLGVVSLLLGILIDPYLSLVIPLAFCAIAGVFFSRGRHVFYLILFVTFIAQGLMTYFAGVGQAFLIPYLLCLLLGIKLIVFRAFWTLEFFKKSTIFVSLIISFWFIFLLSGLTNETPKLTILGIAKNYIFVWFLSFFLAIGVVARGSIAKSFLWVLYLSILQVPFVFFQRLYFAKLGGELNWDAITGTFGGSPYGGGFSGAMTVFQLAASFLAISLYEKKVISRSFMAATVGSFLVTALLGEVKVVIVLIPVAVLAHYRSRLLEKPLKFAGIIVCFFVFYQVLNFVYLTMYQNSGIDVSRNDSILTSIAYEQDMNWFNPETREVSRLGAISLWAKNNESILHILIGHGPAASRTSETLGEGVAAAKYPFTLTTHSVSTLLWDLGLVGLIAFLAILLVLAIESNRLIKRGTALSTVEKCILEFCFIYTFIQIPFLMYNTDAVDTVQAQVMLAIIAGYVIYLKSLQLRGRDDQETHR